MPAARARTASGPRALLTFSPGKTSGMTDGQPMTNGEIANLDDFGGSTGIADDVDLCDSHEGLVYSGNSTASQQPEMLFDKIQKLPGRQNVGRVIFNYSMFDILFRRRSRFVPALTRKEVI